MISEIKLYFKRFKNQYFIDFGNYHRTVFLAGTARSGTTWVEEIINGQNDFRVMFEPFHPARIDLVSSWKSRQYLRSDNRSEEFLKPATAILSGRIKHQWIDQYNRKFFSRKRLIKDIRSQLFLKWMKCNFPEIPIILLLRHPCAVANSKLKLGWDTNLDDFLLQKDLMCDFLEPFQRDMENVSNPYEKHIFRWCIENYIPLKQFNAGEILIIFYEDLCTNTQNEVEKILSFIGERFSSEILQQFSRPSAVSRKDSAIISGANLIDSWKSNITDKQVEKAMEICSIFGLQKIYGRNSLPLLSGNEALGIFTD